jgi:hypothetical protein
MVLPIISALWRLRQEDEEFEISLGYTERAYLKKKKGRKKGRKAISNKITTTFS